MPRPRRRASSLAATAALACLCWAWPAASVAAVKPHPLRTAVADSRPYEGANSDLAFARTRAAGARVVRLYMSWRAIAPEGATKPAGFNARNPGDPRYDWGYVDALVRGAARHGLAPLLSIVHTPTWAQRGRPEQPWQEGTYRPSPAELGAFARAAAVRYSGRFGGLPRVRYYQVGNEPNVFVNLNPQYDTAADQPVTARSRPVSPDLYRDLVNAVTPAVHGVRRDNLVVAGGLAPFGRYVPNGHNVAPLVFMRKLFCLDSRGRPVRSCRKRVKFDVWAFDPYSDGGPTSRSRFAGNASIGDLPKVRRLLEAGVRSGSVVSAGPPDFWVVEFGWNTNPPARGGVPPLLHARWVGEALYHMWNDGVSLVTWFQLRDTKETGLLRQTGLYFECDGGLACDEPKPALQALRFPFVAYRRTGGFKVWGRTPTERPGSVVIDRLVGSAWQRVATVRADRYGIFQGRVSGPRTGWVTARFGAERSFPFSLVPPPIPPGLHPLGGLDRPTEGT